LHAPELGYMMLVTRKEWVEAEKTVPYRWALGGAGGASSATGYLAVIT
jgi:hypothetical protein